MNLVVVKSKPHTEHECGPQKKNPIQNLCAVYNNINVKNNARTAGRGADAAHDTTHTYPHTQSIWNEVRKKRSKIQRRICV